MKRFILIPLLFVVFFAFGQAGFVRAVDQPKFQILSNLHTIVSSTGLRTNTTNAYGTVDAAGSITSVTSILPGPTGRNFTTAGVSTSTIRLIMVNGIPVMDMSGNKWLRSTSSAATYDAFSHNATFANLKWSITMLFRVGYGPSPGHFNSFIGNNAGSAGSKGFSIASDDRNTAIHTLFHTMSKGTAGFISTSNDNNIFTANEFEIWTFTFDGSLAAGSRFKAYKYKTAQTLTVTSASTATVTTPTNVLEIFNIGGGPSTTGGIGQLVMCVMQTSVESQAIREEFIDSITPLKEALNNYSNEVTHPFNYLKDDATRYYLTSILCQNPLTPNVIVKIFRDGSGGHIIDSETHISIQKSTDYGLTWSTKATFYDPAGALSPGDLGGGYDSNGRLWIFTDVRTTDQVNDLPYQIHLLYSDDDGDTAPTDVDITANVPSDGLDICVMHGQLMETSTGRLLFGFYKAEPDLSSWAVYAWFSDDGGTTWGTKTIVAPNAASFNETASIIANDGVTERIIFYIRRDDTFEWHCVSSTDNCNNVIDDGAVSLGESFTVACPGWFSKFNLYGVSVIGYWYTDRSGAQLFKVVYARESTLANNPTLFDLDTKTELRRRQVHYGSIVHTNNDLYSIGSYAEEPVASTLTENKQLTFYSGTFMKDLLMRELNISRP